MKEKLSKSDQKCPKVSKSVLFVTIMSNTSKKRCGIIIIDKDTKEPTLTQSTSNFLLLMLHTHNFWQCPLYFDMRGFCFV